MAKIGVVGYSDDKVFNNDIAKTFQFMNMICQR